MPPPCGIPPIPEAFSAPALRAPQPAGAPPPRHDAPVQTH
ncbi:hypothetical protein C7S15_7298 [Burkholderia cepacia]|nr:hypothetical protein [Burkholderia cepacia]